MQGCQVSEPFYPTISKNPAMMKIYTYFALLFFVFCGHGLLAQTTLPFTEGFENVGTTTTFTSATTNINGLSEWSYEKSARGRLRLSAGSGFNHTGSHAATMDCSSNGTYSNNFLILTLDLSSYKSSNLELDFYFMHHGDERHSGQDKVWVRGSNTSSWVQIYDWYANRPNSGRWKHSGSLDVDAVLSAANQTIGSTFQVRFGQRDNFRATSTTASDGLTVDDIRIIEVLDRNGIITDIDPFCTGTSPVNVELSNYGAKTITSAKISWWVDGTAQTQYNFKGSVAQNASTNITLGNYTFTAKSHDFKVVVDSVNGLVDQNRKDTIIQAKDPAMSGAFTVGANGDFSTPDSAVIAMVDRGICGPVSFTIDYGTYSGMVSIPAINGSSSTNTITFDGQDSSRTTITYNAAARYPTLQINGGQYISFKNLKLQTTKSTDGWCAHVVGNSHHINFENCWFDMPAQNFDLIGIVLANSGTNEFAGLRVSYVNALNNRFTGGEKGIQYSGLTNPFPVGNTAINNTFDNFYTAAIDVRNQDSFIVTGNTATSTRNANGDGFMFYDIDDFNISNNFISVRDWGLYINDANFNGQGRSLLSNNLVTAGDDGIYLNDIRNTDVWHNTTIGRPGILFDDYQGVDVRNNIFYGVNDFALSCDQSSGFDSLDYNLYYSTGTNTARYANVNYTDLDAWKAVITGFNAASIEDVPNIQSVANPRLSLLSESYRGEYLQAISTDIDGDSRCLFAPSIGADESGFPTPKTQAFYAATDTGFVNGTTIFDNRAKSTDPVRHQWIVDGKLEANTTDFSYKFTAAGSYIVDLISEGCGGIDTFSKTIVITIPSVPPTAAFLASATDIDVNESVEFTNISSSGADSFYWVVDSYWVVGDFGLRVKSHQFLLGTDSNSLNPTIEFTSPGSYRVCLYAYNIRGVDSVCKAAHINVRQRIDMCGVADETNRTYGKLFDNGGPLGNYGNNLTCGFLVDPCTDEITLNFNDFNLSGGDFLRIYDGKDNTAPPLHNYHASYANGLTGNITSVNFKSVLTATSGEVYFEFQSNNNGNNRGFNIDWTSKSLTPTKPSVNFIIPDSVCTGVPFVTDNRTTGTDVSYQWFMDTSNLNRFTGLKSENLNTSHHYDTAKTHYVMLLANGCGILDSIIKPIAVVNPTTRPTSAFTISNNRPSIADTVSLGDESTWGRYNCISTWEWIISPSTYGFVTGFDKNSPSPQILLTDTGCYNISLVTTNGAGSDTFTWNCGVYSISTCIPSVKIPNQNFGISRVNIGDIDHSSTVDATGYQNHLSVGSTQLEMGATYQIVVERPSGGPRTMKRAVWVDYNMDGSFDDVTELVASSGSDQNLSWTSSFKIPLGLSEGSTRLRVGVNHGSFNNYGCGPNRFGEFEDYRVFISDDKTAPEVFLVGAKDTTIQKCSGWIDPGAFAIDNVNGRRTTISAFNSIDTTTVGDYTVVYTAKDSLGNEGQATRIVRVMQDTTPPVLTLLGSSIVTLEVFDTYTEPGFTVSDNCGGLTGADVVTIGAPDINALGLYEIEYILDDQAGNSVSVKRSVRVEDTQKPALTLIGQDTIWLEVGSPYDELGVNWTDNYDADLVYKVSGSVDVYQLGTYQITYSMEDHSGNKADDVVRHIIIQDLTAPELRLLNQEDTTIINVLDEKYELEEFFVTDNYDDAKSVEGSLVTSGTYFPRFGDGITTELGLYTVIYTVTDASGNTTSVERWIEVVDQEAPVINFNGPQVVTIPRWGLYDETAVEASDNYYQKSDITLTSTGTVDKNKVGNYIITYCAKDPSGNESCSERTIVVAETAQTVGLNEIAESDVSVYPNPTREFLTIEADLNTHQNLDVSVVDMMGRTVISLTPQHSDYLKTTINVSALQSGPYLVLLKTNNAVVAKRITVER